MAIRLARLALLTCALAAAAPLYAQGVLTFETETWSFGSINEGEQPTYTFRFTNTGDEPVTITHVQPSCGCTAPSYSTEPVAPGDMGEIVVQYDSEGRPGDFNKAISVQALDAANSLTTLRISGTVVPENLHNGVAQGSVVFDADSHTFEDLHVGQAASHTFRMQNMGEHPLTITEARVFNETASVDFPKRMIFPGEIVDVEVSIPNVDAALSRSGELDLAIVLVTDDPEQPAKSLRLRGRPHSEEHTPGTD